MAKSFPMPPPLTVEDVVEALNQLGIGTAKSQTQTLKTNVKINGGKEVAQLAEDSERARENLENIGKIQIKNGAIVEFPFDAKKVSADLLAQLQSVFNKVNKNRDNLFNFPEDSKTLRSLQITKSLPELDETTTSVLKAKVAEKYPDETYNRKEDITKKVSTLMRMMNLIDDSKAKISGGIGNISDVKEVTLYADALKKIIRATSAFPDAYEDAQKYLKQDKLGFSPGILDGVKTTLQEAEAQYEALQSQVDEAWYYDIMHIDKGKKNGVTNKDIEKILNSRKAIYQDQTEQVREARNLQKQTTSYGATEKSLKQYVIPQEDAYKELEKISNKKWFKEGADNPTRDFSGYLASYLGQGGDIKNVLKLLNKTEYFGEKFEGKNESKGIQMIMDTFGLNGDYATYFSKYQKEVLTKLITDANNAQQAMAQVNKEITDSNMTDSEKDFLKSIGDQFDEAVDKATNLKKALDLLKLSKSDDSDAIVSEFSQRDWTTNQTLRFLSGNPNAKINSKKDRKNTILGILTEDQKKNLTPETMPQTESKTAAPISDEAEKAVGEAVQSLQMLVQTEEEAIEKSQRLARAFADAFGVNSTKTIDEAAESIKNILMGNSDNYDGILSVFANDNKLKRKYSNGDENGLLDFVSYVRKSKIAMSPDVVSEFGDEWNLVRNTIGSKVLVNNGGTNISSFLEEMNKTIGTTFEVTGVQADDFRTLYEAIAEKTNGVKHALNGLESMGFDSEYVRNTILDDLKPATGANSSTDVATEANDKITKSNQEVNESEQKKREAIAKPVTPPDADPVIETNDRITESNEDVEKSEEKKREAAHSPIPQSTPPASQEEYVDFPETPPNPSSTPPSKVNTEKKPPKQTPPELEPRRLSDDSDIIRQRGYRSDGSYSETRKLGVAAQQTIRYMQNEDGNYEPFVSPVELNYETLLKSINNLDSKLLSLMNEKARAQDKGIETPALDEEIAFVRGQIKKVEDELDKYGGDTDYSLERKAFDEKRRENTSKIWNELNTKNEKQGIKTQEKLSDKISKDNKKLDNYVRMLDANYNNMASSQKLQLDEQQLSQLETKKDETQKVISDIRQKLSNENRGLNSTDIDEIERSVAEYNQFGRDLQDTVQLNQQRQKSKENVEKTLNGFLRDISASDSQFLHDVTKPIKESDLDSMKKSREDAESFINSFRDKDFLTPDDMMDLQLVRDNYRQEVKNVQRENYFANKLSPDTMSANIESLRTDVNMLLNDMKESGTVTTEFEKNLRENVLNNLTNDIDVSTLQTLRDEFKKTKEQFKSADDDFKTNKKDQSDESYQKEISAIKEIYRLKEKNAELEESNDKYQTRKTAENNVRIQSLKNQIAGEQQYRTRFGLNTDQGEDAANKAEADAMTAYNQKREEHNALLKETLPFLEEEARLEEETRQKADAEDAYQSQLNVIKQLVEEQTKLNELQTKQTNKKKGEDYSSAIAEQEEIVRQQRQMAQDAVGNILQSAFAVQNGDRKFGPTLEQVQDASDMFETQGQTGSVESAQNLAKAKSVSEIDKTEKGLSDLKKAASEYNAAMKAVFDGAYNDVSNKQWTRLCDAADEAKKKFKDCKKAAEDIGVPDEEIEKVEKLVQDTYETDKWATEGKIRNRINTTQRSLKMPDGKGSARNTLDSLKILASSYIDKDIDNTDNTETVFSNFRSFMTGLSEELKSAKNTDKKEVDTEKLYDSLLKRIEKLKDDSENDLPEQKEQLGKLEQTLSEIYSNYKAPNTGLYSDEDTQKIKEATDALNKLNNEVDDYKKNVAKTKKNDDGSIIQGTLGQINDMKSLKSAFDDYVEEQKGCYQHGIKLDNAGKKVSATLTDQNGVVKKVTASWDENTKSMRILEKEMDGFEKEADETKTVFGDLMEHLTMTLDIGDVIQFASSKIRDAIDLYKQYDASLTNISYTMDLTREGLHSLGDDALDMAEKLSLSFQDAMGIYEIYANQNTTAEEITAIATPTAILSNISGVDTETTSDQIQGVLQQFDMLSDSVDEVAQSSMHVVDALSYLSANVSIDNVKAIGIMSDAIQASGAEAYQAGLSFEQLAAISAKISERTRDDGSSIGNALKTIIVRLSKVGSMPGYEAEVSNEEISKAAQSLDEIGIEVYKANGEFRQLDTILGELNAKWDTLTDAQKANISYNVAA